MRDSLIDLSVVVPIYKQVDKIELQVDKIELQVERSTNDLWG